MVRHIVLIKFKPKVSDAEIADIWANLYDLKHKISGLIDIKAGKSQSPEQIERGYMHGFTIDFDGWEALLAYQDHPEHRKFGARLLAHAMGGPDGILVFDLAA